MPTSLKLMLFFWQVGLVDTFSLIQFCINSGTQYGAIVVASAAGNFSDISPTVLFEPIIGLGTSYQFIRAAQTETERRARIATLAAFLSTSATSTVTMDPATNAALGGGVASKIAYMRAILTRGGESNNIAKSISSSSLKEFFDELQSGLYVTSFRDDYYRSLVIIPQVEFKRCPREKYLLANVWVVEDLFYYQHPFILPDFFQQKPTKHEFKVI